MYPGPNVPRHGKSLYISLKLSPRIPRLNTINTVLGYTYVKRGTRVPSLSLDLGIKRRLERLVLLLHALVVKNR